MITLKKILDSQEMINSIKSYDYDPTEEFRKKIH